jgi:1-acyl-sn-glycerol-3-phosphate acyltransferase
VIGAVPDVVELVSPGSIRRTPSRKIRRGETRDAFLSGKLERPTRPAALELAEFVRSEARPALGRAGRLTSDWLFAMRAWVSVLAAAAPVAALVWLPLSVAARWRLIRWALRAVVATTGIRIHAQGALPDEGTPSVIVANHSSFVDAAVLILSSAGPLTFVTSTDFERKAVIGPFLRRIGCAFVERGDPARTTETLGMLAGLVRSGSRLVVFPEGSISPSPGVRPFHLGAFAVAAATGSRIVPVALVGTREVLRAGSFFPRRADVSLLVGDAVDPPGSDFADEVAASDKVRGVLAALLGEALVGVPTR